MNIFWNILWIFPFFGWIWAILYGILGLCVCATVVGLPIGLGLLQYSKFLFWPHGNAMISKSDLEIITEKERPLWWKIFAMIVRILYFPFGLLNAIGGTLYGFVCFLTIIGIPEGLVMMKSIGTLFNPINKVMVPAALRDEIERVKALRRYSPSSKNQASSGNSTPSQQPLAVTQTSSEKIASSGNGVVFCNKCGASLPEGSAFCSKCGSAVVVEIEEKVKTDSDQPTQDSSDNINSELPPAIPSMPLDSSYPEDLDNNEDQKKNILMYCGIGAAVIVIAVAIWAIWFRKGEENVGYILAESTALYKYVEDGNGVEYLSELSYGTPVEYSKDNGDEEGWVKVSVKEAGKTVHGFIPSGIVVDKDIFDKVDKAGFGDFSLRSSAVSTTHRQAIVQALNNKDQWWHLEKMDYNGGSGELNGKAVLIRGAYPSERCFAFVLANDSAKWVRELYVYSFTEGDEPVMIFSENLNEKNGRFRDVSIKNGQYKTLYDKVDPNIWLVSPVNETVHEEYVSDKETEKGVQLGEPIYMSGLVDGKYPVKMELNLHGDCTVSGTVTYVKYNVPMGIVGTYSFEGNRYDLSLEEMSDGKVTGNFIGKFDGRVFSGSWVKEDGSREMPFRCERE